MRTNTLRGGLGRGRSAVLIVSLLTDLEYQEILRMAGIVATPGIPLP